MPDWPRIEISSWKLSPAGQVPGEPGDLGGTVAAAAADASGAGVDPGVDEREVAGVAVRLALRGRVQVPPRLG